MYLSHYMVLLNERGGKTMLYQSVYYSPVGKITIVSNKDHLVGLWIEGQKYFLGSIKEEMIDKETDVLKDTKEWLDRYFKHQLPQISELPLAPMGSEFSQIVWQILIEIPYGEVITYGEIAKIVATKLQRKSMSSQAVGNAVGRNPISIIIPCHRVVGKNGSLTGYAGGVDKKAMLLKLEGVDISKFTFPK